MLLSKFRNKQIYLISTMLIVFALLAKILVPIAHAGNGSSGEKGFLASLCSGNKVVLVEFKLPNDNKPQPSTVVAGSKCPLCNIIEQHAPINTATSDGIVFAKVPHTFNLTDNVATYRQSICFSGIRAPPTFS